MSVPAPGSTTTTSPTTPAGVDLGFNGVINAQYAAMKLQNDTQALMINATAPGQAAVKARDELSDLKRKV